MSDTQTGTLLKPLSGQLITDHRTVTSVISDKSNSTPAQAYIKKHANSEAQRVASVKVKHVAQLLGFKNADQIAWEQVTFNHANYLRSKLMEATNRFGESLSPSTINHTLTAFRQMAKLAWRMGIMSAEIYEHVKSIEPVRGERVGLRALPVPDDITALLDCCFADPGVAGARDAAIITLAFGAGLRRSELVGLMYPRHIDEQDSSIIVRGKGNKERRIPLAHYMLDVLQTWIHDVRGNHSGPLFSRVRKGDDIASEALSDEAVRYILERRCLQAGVKPIKPHDARHTYASNLLANNTDLVTVSKLLGHASIVTTQRYIHKHMKDMRDAVNNNLTIFDQTVPKLAKSEL